MKSLLLCLLVLTIFWTTHAQDTCSGVCGRRPLANSHASTFRIVGGTDVLPGTWPWQVSLQMPYYAGYWHFCGGVLLSSRWVLTAAHCFNGTEGMTRKLKVLLGSTNLINHGRNAETRHIRSVIMHERFIYYGLENDIALVELSMPVKCSDYIQPACLPDETMDVSRLTHCWATGWGRTNPNDPNALPTIMQEAKVNVIPTEICNRTDWNQGWVHEYKICAGYEEGGIGPCQGDSGGPLSCREPRSERFYVVGVFCGTYGCNQPKKPGTYTSTQYFLNWIRAKTRLSFKPPVVIRTKPTPPRWSFTPRPYQTQKPIFTQRPFEEFKPISEIEFKNFQNEVWNLFKKLRPNLGGPG